MILVTLGTQDKSFPRLIKAVDDAVKEGYIREKVIVQAGCTEYSSENLEIFGMTSPEEMRKLIKEARVVITHGGVGSILSAIELGKPVIAMARLEKYGEHHNDHQLDIISAFEQRGYIFQLSEEGQLNELLQKCRKFTPDRFPSNQKQFNENILNYIKCDDHTSWWNRFKYVAIVVGLCAVLVVLVL